MERTLKDLCFTINGLSTEFSVMGRIRTLPQQVRNACTRVGIELLDLDRQLYFASFIKNDTKIIALVDKIQEAADQAADINRELEELTEAVRKARKVVHQASDLIAKASETAEDLPEKIQDALRETERVLDVFGIEVDLSDLGLS